MDTELQIELKFHQARLLASSLRRGIRKATKTLEATDDYCWGRIENHGQYISATADHLQLRIRELRRLMK